MGAGRQALGVSATPQRSLTMVALANHYQIRTANLNDIDTVVSFWQAIDKEGEPRPFGGDTADKPKRAKKIVAHTLESPRAELLVCTYKGVIVGTITGHVFEKPAVKLSPIGVIYSLWVETAHRKQGIAQHLLTTIENTLKNLGAQAIQVGWDSPNSYAEKWWLARGYEPYEVIASKVI